VADPGQNRTVCAGSFPTTSICCNGVCCDGCCGSDDADPPAACGACLVFVTDDPTIAGTFGSLGAGDSICQMRADNVTPDSLPGTYKAWLSSASESAVSRLRHSAQPYELLSGDRVADDFAGLLNRNSSNPLLHAIDRTELNTDVASLAGQVVWTGTLPNGGADPFPRTCGGWTGVGEFGRQGAATATIGAWTSISVETNCTATKRLYCFQQT
jgi:hypothetical protein